MRQRHTHLDSPPMIESLEPRQLLSSNVSLAFTGRLPTVLPPTGTTRVALRLTDTGTSPIHGPLTVRLFASTDATPDAGDLQLNSTVESVRLNPRRSAKVTIPVQSPTGLSNGSYYLLAEADGYPAVAVSAKPLGFANPFSDVAVQFAKLPPSRSRSTAPRQASAPSPLT